MSTVHLPLVVIDFLLTCFWNECDMVSDVNILRWHVDASFLWQEEEEEKKKLDGRKFLWLYPSVPCPSDLPDRMPSQIPRSIDSDLKRDRVSYLHPIKKESTNK